MTESSPNPAVEAPAEPLQSWSVPAQAGWDGGESADGNPSGAAGQLPSAGEPPVAPGPGAAAQITKLTSERPELLIAAAFVGGLLLATIIKRLGS